MSEIEVTEADIAAVKAIESEERKDIKSDADLRTYLQVAFARHRIAAQADVAARVAEAVKGERERCSGLAGALMGASAAEYAEEDGSYALEAFAECVEEVLMQPTPHAEAGS